jgi:type IV pilus assembly protein PilN
VSELLRNLGSNSPWFTRPELLEIVAGNISLGKADQRRVANYKVTVKLLRASEAQKAASAASSATSGLAPIAVPASSATVAAATSTEAASAKK